MPPSSNIFDIKRNERVAVMGMTGSGKTFACRALLSPVKRLIVMDPKGLLYGQNDWNLKKWADGIDKLKAGKSARLWIPPMATTQEWEYWFTEIMKLRNVVVYIDELYGVGPASGSPGLRALYTRGRELGLGVWACFQRPRWIPGYAMSESEWVLQFRLEIEDDRKFMTQRIGPAAMYRLLEHACNIYRTGGKTYHLPNGITVVKQREKVLTNTPV